MNRQRFYMVRVCLFVIGIFIILYAGTTLKTLNIPDWNIRYILVSALLIYFAAFLPFLLVFIRRDKVDAQIVGGGIYYKAAGTYIILTLCLMYGAAIDALPERPLIIGQLALLFAFAIYVYLALFSSIHIQNVREEETKITVNLNEAKGLAKDTAALIEGAEWLDAGIREKLSKILGEIRYISPSDDDRARDLEQKMCDVLNAVNMYLEGGSLVEGDLENQIEKLSLLCGRRKNIYRG